MGNYNSISKTSITLFIISLIAILLLGLQITFSLISLSNSCHTNNLRFGDDAHSCVSLDGKYYQAYSNAWGFDWIISKEPSIQVVNSHG